MGRTDKKILLKSWIQMIKSNGTIITIDYMTSKELYKVFTCTYSDVPIESGIINDEISFSRILNSIESCDQYIYLKRKIRNEKRGTRYMVFKIENNNNDNLSLNDTTINDSDI